MKALDTPLLLAFLRGETRAVEYVRSLQPEEAATTELNLWELGILAGENPPRGREGRFDAIEKLRRKLVVLPLDSASTNVALRLRRAAQQPTLERTLLILGILESHGCTEWVTLPEALPRTLRATKVRVESFAKKNAKTRK